MTWGVVLADERLDRVTIEVVDLNETWQSFKATGDLRLRNDLVMAYQGLLKQVSARIGASLPSSVDREDLVSYGVFGLMDAIEKFDLDRGIKFETYAGPRIRGAIIDHLRTMDWVPRSIRTKAKDLEKARLELETELGREPEDSEIATKLGISIDDLWIMKSQASISSVSALEEGEGDEDRMSIQDLVYDPSSNPEDLFSASEIIDMVSRAVAGMSERSKTIVTLYYIEEMTLAEIGELLGVTESRVCQLQSKVLQGLHESFVMREAVSA